MTTSSDEQQVDDEPLTSDELEEMLLDEPDNVDLQEELADVLFEDCAFGDRLQRERKTARLRALLSELAPERALLARAYVAYLDGDDTRVLTLLCNHATDLAARDGIELHCDTVVLDLLQPFSDSEPEGLWSALADTFEAAGARPSIILTLRGMAAKTDEEAIDYYARALEDDEECFWAAFRCGTLYAAQRNWRAALGYYKRALAADLANNMSVVWINYAACCEKLSQWGEAESAWATVAEIAPNHPYARNSRGWSLIKQGKYESAVEVLKENLRRGNVDKYVLNNLALALTRLGRYAEAIDYLRQDIEKGTVHPKSQQKIASLESLLAAQGGKVTTQVVNEIDEFEDQREARVLARDEGSPSELQEERAGAPEPEDEPQTESAPEPGRARKRRGEPSRSLHSEHVLETFLEERILRGLPAFGRNLKMYESPSGVYGRQFAIPGIGRIDLLVLDADTNELVIIELKRDRTTDEVIGQLCRYLGWVKQNLASEQQTVRGVICVHEASEQLRVAASVVPGVEVFEYAFDFGKV